LGLLSLLSSVVFLCVSQQGARGVQKQQKSALEKVHASVVSTPKTFYKKLEKKKAFLLPYFSWFFWPFFGCFAE
jgi:hypothetical protein